MEIDISHNPLQLLNSARQKFGGGEPVPTDLIPDALVRSWSRSREAGVLPWHEPQYELADPSRNVRESLDNRQLYRCIVDEIEQLWEAFGGTDWTIFCVNPQGTVIHARRSPQCTHRIIQPIVVGRRVLESHIGTTAPSCVLHENQATIVSGGQHYLNEFDQVFCLAVPLYGLQGDVIGALDITGIGQRDPRLVVEQFRLAALVAQQRMFATLRGCHLLRIHHDPRWLETPLSGVLAVDEDGHIRAVSRAGRRMLSMMDRGPVPDITLRQLFDGPSDSVDSLLGAKRRAQHNPRRLTRPDGSHLWLLYVRAPKNRGTARHDAYAADINSVGASLSTVQHHRDRTMKDEALAVVQRAMCEHGGNISAVARQLGVSRTTVYAWLAQVRDAGIANPCERQHEQPRVGLPQKHE